MLVGRNRVPNTSSRNPGQETSTLWKKPQKHLSGPDIDPVTFWTQVNSPSSTRPHAPLHTAPNVGVVHFHIPQSHVLITRLHTHFTGRAAAAATTTTTTTITDPGYSSSQFWPGRGNIYLFFKVSRRILALTQSHIQWVAETFPRGV
jgi:hypothetical protein